LRNNKGIPLFTKPPGQGTLAGMNFKGRFNAFALSPGFSYQGSNAKGNFKLRRGNQHQKAGLALRKSRSLIEYLPGRLRSHKYHTGARLSRGNQHQKAGPALRKSRSLIEYFPGRLRSHKYHTGAKISQGNQHQKAGLALRKNRSLLEYFPGTLRAHKYHTGTRISRGNQHQKAGSELLRKRSLFQYIPGSIRAHNYRGNYRFKRYSKRNLHPSSNFARSTVNPKEEKERFFMFKIWFTRLFKKTDNRPNQKNKDRRPRYDKDESKIWYN